MNLKKLLIKMANHFDEKGNIKLANEIDQTLEMMDDQERIMDPSLLLEEKTPDDITENDLNTFAAVLMTVSDELEKELGIDSEELRRKVFDIVRKYNK